jgi:hypothetical protein
LTADNHPLQADVYMRLLKPREWANDALRATKIGFPLPPSLTELALRMTGDINRAEDMALKADLAYMRLKNSGDLMRYESQRALEEQIRWDDATNPQPN